MLFVPHDYAEGTLGLILSFRWAGLEERASMRVNVSGDSTESNGIQVLT